MKAVLLISLFLIIPITSFKALGIDLSGWDDVVHWDTLKNQVKFVILRAGIGQGGTDSVYEKYYKKCKEIGMPVGAYWYAKATTVKGARQEANYFLAKLKGKKFEFPVYYDVEEPAVLDTGADNVNALITTFCGEIEKHGYYCGLYCSTNYLNNLIFDEVKNKYAIWVAHWNVDWPTYKGPFGIWQYTSDGHMDGVESERVDLDLALVNYEPIIKFLGKNGYDKYSK